MHPPIQVRLEQASPTVYILRLRGDLVALAKPPRGAAYSQACQAGAKTIISHCRPVDHLNSAGISSLFGMALYETLDEALGAAEAEEERESE